MVAEQPAQKHEAKWATVSERDELILRVCQQPSEDFPRLLFADWCDGDGQHERAEFIRVQLALAGLPPEHVCLHGMGACGPKLKCPGCDLRRPERELLSGSLGLWFRGKGFPQTAEYVDAARYKRHTTKQSPAPIVAVLWTRGFVESVTCTAAQWLAHGPAIVRQQPITRVVLSDREPAQISDNGRQYYYWLSPSNDIGVAAEYIPGCAYKWLKRGERNRFRWGSPQAAIEALSDAALLWARTEAGLEVAS